MIRHSFCKDVVDYVAVMRLCDDDDEHRNRLCGVRSRSINMDERDVTSVNPPHKNSSFKELFKAYFVTYMS